MEPIKPLPPAAEREQPPIEKAGRSLAFRPRFAWVEAVEQLRDGAKERRGLKRAIPSGVEARAQELEEQLLAMLRLDGLPEPPAGEIRDHLLHVIAHIPVGDQQRVEVALRDDPPFYAITTRRGRG
jgi:hypothetical protein